MFIPDEVKGEGPAVVGAMVGILVYFRDLNWKMKAVYFLVGWALAHVFAQNVQSIGGFAIGTAQCVAALFSLAILEKLYDMLRSFDAKKATSDLWQAILKRFGG